jgi:hypothetical protein
MWGSFVHLRTSRRNIDVEPDAKNPVGRIFAAGLPAFPRSIPKRHLLPLRVRRCPDVCPQPAAPVSSPACFPDR